MNPQKGRIRTILYAPDQRFPRFQPKIKFRRGVKKDSSDSQHFLIFFTIDISSSERAVFEKSWHRNIPTFAKITESD
jgi:hypothetical protein